MSVEAILLNETKFAVISVIITTTTIHAPIYLQYSSILLEVFHPLLAIFSFVSHHISI